MTIRTVATLLVVSDIDASISFYRELLGLAVLGTYPERRPFQWAMLQSGPVRIQLQTIGAAARDLPFVQRQPLGGSFLLFLEVTDLDATALLLQSWSKPIMQSPESTNIGKEIAFRDPDGYYLIVTQAGQP